MSGGNNFNAVVFYVGNSVRIEGTAPQLGAQFRQSMLVSCCRHESVAGSQVPSVLLRDGD